MSFNALESSIFGGSPIELYEFSVLGQLWRYTTDDRATTFNASVFEPVSELSRGSIRVTQNIERTEVRISLRGNVGIAEQFRVTPPSEPVKVKIYKKHRTDPDYIVRWRGRVQSCTWEGPMAVLSCVSVHSSLKQPGLRRSFQYQCPHALYDNSCGVRQDNHEFILSVTAINGVVITLPITGTFSGVNYYAGGYLAWETLTGRQETRMVTESTATTVTLQSVPLGLSVGTNIRLYTGCDHTVQTCASKFSNVERFGGFPFIPSTNPFGGTTIF